MLMHAGVKLNICDTCGKRFIDNGALKKHLSVHTGDKPYMCKFCGRCFGQKAHLDRHIVIP